ncbi:MAG: FAD-dependent monooxygenase [Pirellulales bacterium]
MSSSLPQEVSVLVAGAGPTGLLLAAELCRRGVDCLLIDAHDAPLHWDRATVVHPRSLEVFESLGIVEPLLAAGVKQRVARVHSAGALLGQIDLALCGSRYPFNIGISEEVTESILNDYLESRGGSVVRSSRLVGLEQREVDVLATIQHGDKTEQVVARWVVGCDGVRSATRELVGIELAGHDIAAPWAVFDATVPGWAESFEANYAYLDAIPVILTSLPQERWRVYLRPSSDESDLVADALTTLRGYMPGLAFDDVTHPTRFHCHTRVAARYRAGRVLLAGDAAHVCSPSQGHGMNSGLQDAYNLAWKLALVCQGRCASTLFESYEAERRPVAEMITASGDAFEAAQDLTDPAARRTRDEALRAVFADPQTRHHESIAEAELDIDYSNSPIVMGDAHERLAPGQRLPSGIEVRLAEDRPCLLHELAHRAGHTALLIAGYRAPIDEWATLRDRLLRPEGASLLEAAYAQATAPPSVAGHFRLGPAGAGELGVERLTLLVIRPDGHVGLRADHNHLAALGAYEALLRAE